MLHQMGFKPSTTVPSTWMKYSKDDTHHEHIAVYIDDLAIYMEDPKPFCDKLRKIAPFNYHLGCGHTRNEDNTTNTLSKHWEFANIWPLLKPLLFWKGAQMTSMPRQRGVTEFQPQRALSNPNPNG